MKNSMIRILIVALSLVLVNQAEAKTYLVSVGIADYSGYPAAVNNLRLTVQDAKTIAAIYNINGSAEYSLLLDSKATKENIIKTTENLFSLAGKDDTVIFFFSGHGYPGGFCACDGEIGYDEIRDAMKDSKCQNKMMFVDACHSGGIRVNSSRSNSAVEAAKKANVILFLSSRTNEYSIERADMKNGYFTTFLQKGLRGNADTNRDRVITAKELFLFVHKGVSDISGGMQHPVMWGKFNDNIPVLKW